MTKVAMFELLNNNFESLFILPSLTKWSHRRLWYLLLISIVLYHIKKVLNSNHDTLVVDL